MTPSIDILVRPNLDFPLDSAFLRDAALQTLSHQRAPEALSLTLVLSDDEEIRALNRAYRGVDAPTDVLSFSANERDVERDVLYLGDVILSLPRAAEQAAQKGHSLKEELTLLAVHGVLHLLGHDHAEAEEKARMWRAQEEILDSLGVSRDVIPS
jgi:probable rRNA maturation factor